MKPARRAQAEADEVAPAAPPVAVPAGLVYVSDAMPGHRRVRRGASFAYRRPDGRWLADEAELARIRRLAIPPAYTDVWICPLPHGHLQATGRDARGRKQYRYHADWSAERGDTKYARLEAFGRALPRIRARVARDLRGAGPGAPVERAQLLATLLRLLDATFVRVGNESYARDPCADARQCAAEGLQPRVLAVAALGAPLRVVAVLLAAARVAARGLDVAARRGRDPDVAPGRRDREPLDAVEPRAIAQRQAARVEEAKATTGPDPAESGRAILDVAKPGERRRMQRKQALARGKGVPAAG